MIKINFHLSSLTEKKPQSIWAEFYIENAGIRIDTNQFIKPDDKSKDKKKLLTSYKEDEKAFATQASSLKIKILHGRTNNLLLVRYW